MDKIDIDDVIVTPLKRIQHPKGDVLHGMKKSDEGFVDFGEAYFSTINGGDVKGWNRHTRMTLNLVVPVGRIAFVLYDDRENSPSKGKFVEVELSPDKYKRLTVPPYLWMGFKGKSDGLNLLLNIADMEHDPDEIERLDIDKIGCDWDLV